MVITDINNDAGHATAKMLGDQALFVQHDVTQASQWQNVIEHTISAYGNLNILVNNAGVCIFNGLLDYSLEEIQTTLNINLLSVMLELKPRHRIFPKPVAAPLSICHRQKVCLQ